MTSDFDNELATLIERHSVRLTSDQIITGLERALDDALVLAGDPEASKIRTDLLEALGQLVVVMGLDHARNCPARVCDCDLDDTRDHAVRSARAAIAKARGQ